jgi:hypothetical protein
MIPSRQKLLPARSHNFWVTWQAQPNKVWKPGLKHMPWNRWAATHNGDPHLMVTGGRISLWNFVENEAKQESSRAMWWAWNKMRFTVRKSQVGMPAQVSLLLTLDKESPLPHSQLLLAVKWDNSKHFKGNGLHSVQLMRDTMTCFHGCIGGQANAGITTLKSKWQQE